MTTGERIRFLRLQNNMTMEELASKIGLQKAAIYKYETGLVKNLKRDTIDKLSLIFGVSPSYLMCLDDQEKKEKATAEISNDLPKAYYELTAQQRELVDSLIRQLAEKKSNQ